jgi:hypothetical protein
MDKHLSKHLEPKNNIEFSVKKQQEIDYVFHGTIKPPIGHFIWEINESTLEVKKAEFKTTTAVFGATKPIEKMIVKPNCVYIPALNAHNAIKKYQKSKRTTLLRKHR